MRLGALVWLTINYIKHGAHNLLLRKIRQGQIILSFLLFCYSFNSYSASDVKKITVACNENNVPVCFWDDNGNPSGIDVDIVRELARRMGMVAEFRLIPWRRLLEEVKHGKVDAAMPMFITAERKSYVSYPNEPLHESVMTAFARENSTIHYRQVSDLYGKRVGIRRGYSISPEFDQAARSGKIKMTEVSSVTNLIRMVLTGRLDVLIDKRVTIEYYMKNNSNTLLNIGEVSRGEAYLALSKSAAMNSDIETLLNVSNTLKQMKSDGAYERITNQYMY